MLSVKQTLISETFSYYPHPEPQMPRVCRTQPRLRPKKPNPPHAACTASLLAPPVIKMFVPFGNHHF
jgi:hypothetical protein